MRVPDNEEHFVLQHYPPPRRKWFCDVSNAVFYSLGIMKIDDVHISFLPSSISPLSQEHERESCHVYLLNEFLSTLLSELLLF
jgi:hypothetical protein